MSDHMTWLSEAYEAIEKDDFDQAVASFDRVISYLEKINVTEYQEYTDSILSVAKIRLWKLDEPEKAQGSFKKIIEHYFSSSELGSLTPQAIDKFLISLYCFIVATTESSIEQDLLVDFTDRAYEFIQPQINGFEFLEPRLAESYAKRAQFFESIKDKEKAKSDLKTAIKIFERHLDTCDEILSETRTNLSRMK